MKLNEKSWLATLSKTFLWNGKNIYWFKMAKTILQKMLVAEEIDQWNEYILSKNWPR